MSVPILIINRRRDYGGEYVGRPSPLGNPFQIGVNGRDAVIDAYVAWLQYKIKTKDPATCKELERLRQKAIKDGQLTLACWCAPLRCHASVIAEALTKALDEDISFCT